MLQETYANILACDYTTNEPEFEDISDEAKGGLISQSFSLYLKSPNKCAKSHSRGHKTLQVDSAHYDKDGIIMHQKCWGIG